MKTCELNCDEQYCDVCQNQELMTYDEKLAQINLIVKRARLDMAKQTCVDIEKLLIQARHNVCVCLGEYERAKRKSGGQ